MAVRLVRSVLLAAAMAQAVTVPCRNQTGGRRITELFMGHWDAVNVFVVAPPTVTGRVQDFQIAGEVLQSALCAAPLSLALYGVPPCATTAKRRDPPFSTLPCDAGDGFFSVTSGWSETWRGDASPPEPSSVPSYRRRLALPRADRVTRVAFLDALQDWGVVKDPNPLHSNGSRPSDVAVVVLGDDASADAVSTALREPLLALARDTLHAIILFGRVCDRYGLW